MWEPMVSKSRNLCFKHVLLASVLTSGEPHPRAWIKVPFAKHGVEIASHPYATSVVQPALLKGTFFQMLFWIYIIMQISSWNDVRSSNLIDLELVWQVHMLPKLILFDVYLMWWGNPGKSSDLLSLWLHWPVHWNYSSNAFNITQSLTTILPDEAFI